MSARKPWGPSALAFKCDIPAVPTILQEDDVVRITRWDFSPGAVTGWHQHEWPYFVVLLTDARMCIHDGDKVTELNFIAGHSYRRPAGIKHDVMNGGETPMAFVEIEVKQPDRLAAIG
jgi:quercetin dioxygenase-like cupin family protein